jgi:hypothetical protein
VVEMPDFLDAERLSQLSIAVIVILAALGIFVAQVVKTIVTKVLYLAVIGVAVFSVYAQRDQLQQCQETCSCSLFGREVAVPANPVCGDERVEIPRWATSPATADYGVGHTCCTISSISAATALAR